MNVRTNIVENFVNIVMVVRCKTSTSGGSARPLRNQKKSGGVDRVLNVELQTCSVLLKGWDIVSSAILGDETLVV